MAFVFDLDGTLVDSLPGIADALNRALADQGLPTHPLPAVRGFIGNGSRALARRALPDPSDEDLAARVEDGFRTHYASLWKPGTRLFPGIAALVSRLHAAGRPLAVLSNKPDTFTREIVAHFFPGGEFARAIGQSAHVPPKPAPDALRHLLAEWAVNPAEARLVGDSTVDRDTAANARVPFIGVAWGYHDAGLLGPEICADTDALEARLAAV